MLDVFVYVTTAAVVLYFYFIGLSGTAKYLAPKNVWLTELINGCAEMKPKMPVSVQYMLATVALIAAVAWWTLHLLWPLTVVWMKVGEPGIAVIAKILGRRMAQASTVFKKWLESTPATPRS